jgi:cytochrome c oxidase assembly protein subunit 19
MSEYLTCLKSARGMNNECRDLAKRYLECRMERNLMAQDEMKNLGFQDDVPKDTTRDGLAGTGSGGGVVGGEMSEKGGGTRGGGGKT